MKWIQWLIGNEFVHIRSFLYPMVTHESVPEELRARIHRRLATGFRLMKIRIVVYLIMFPAILGFIAWTVVDALKEVVGGPFVEGLSVILGVVLQVVGVLVVFAGIALLILQRALMLTRVDLLVLSMEAVSLGVKGGAPLPSTQRVDLKKPKK